MKRPIEADIIRSAVDMTVKVGQELLVINDVLVGEWREEPKRVVITNAPANSEARSIAQREIIDAISKRKDGISFAELREALGFNPKDQSRNTSLGMKLKWLVDYGLVTADRLMGITLYRVAQKEAKT